MSITTRRFTRSKAATPDVSAPLTITNVTHSTSNSTLTVTWTTNKPADSRASLYFGPAKHCSWNWQLTGTLDTSANAQVYDFDGFEGTTSQVSQLHARGIYCIAYFGGGDWEDFRDDAGNFPPAILGNNIDGWAGEKLIDIRQLAVLRPLMAARADTAKSKGFDAIEWDCVEGYLESTGFPLTQADQQAFNKMLAQITHERGMACFLKNCPSNATALEPYFEGNLVEESYRYNEEAAHMAFANANKPVLCCEYRAMDVPQVNQDDANTRGYSLILHNLNLNSKYVASYVVGPSSPVTLTPTASPKITSNLTTNHSQTFTGLTPGQQYGFLVWSTAGGETVYDTVPHTFVM